MPLILDSRSSSEIEERRVALGSWAAPWTSSIIEVEVFWAAGGG